MRNRVLTLLAFSLLLAACAGDPVKPEAQLAQLQDCKSFREVTRSPGTNQNMFPRSLIPTRYPDVARVLDLTPAEATELFDILADRQADGPTVFVRGPYDPQQLPENVREMITRQEASDACIHLLLGDRFVKWQAYQQTLPSRVQVHRLRTMLDATGQPLSDARVESLVAAFAALQRRMMMDVPVNAPRDIRESDLGTNSTLNLERNRQLIIIADEWLDAQQLATFQKMLDDDASGTIDLMRRMRSPQLREGTLELR